MNRTALFPLAIALASCIGTDTLDDPLVGERIIVSATQVSLLVDSTAVVSATYFDPFGNEQDFQLHWQSSNAGIASVSAFGEMYGVSPGQTTVRAGINNVVSPDILVTVVQSASEVAQVNVSSTTGTVVAIGSSIALSVAVQNVLGEPITNVEVQWFSSNEGIATVTQGGIVTGIASGSTMVWAMADGIMSNQILITVGSTERTGTFQGANGYNASGSARLFYDQGGSLMLELSSNFQTSFALGTFVYLSNSIQGPATAASGLEVAGITTNGYKLFNVSAISPGTSLNTYTHVIILCKPASITFGFAALQ